MNNKEFRIELSSFLIIRNHLGIFGMNIDPLVVRKDFCNDPVDRILFAIAGSYYFHLSPKDYLL